MLTQISILSRHDAAEQLSKGLARLGRWWLREFLSLLPQPTARWLVGPGKTTLLLSQRDGCVALCLHLDNEPSIVQEHATDPQEVASLISDVLREHQLTRAEASIGIALQPEQFFQRTLILPSQAARALDEIVARDLAQKTPFKPSDIYYDYTVTSEAGKLAVRQLLTRCDSVRTAAIAFGINPNDVDFIARADRHGSVVEGTTIRLRKERQNTPSWVGRIAVALAASALLLASITGALTYWRQASILDELAPQIAKARRQARSVRTAFAKAERSYVSIRSVLAKKYQTPSLLDIWEEATHLLPSDSWLSELRVTEIGQDYRISISGFSAAAAKLVGVFEQSPIFRNASLTTAVTLDPLEQRERFSMQAQVRVSAVRSSVP